MAIGERAGSSVALDEERLRRIVGNAPVGLFEADPHGNLTFVTTKWCEIAGISSADAMGRGWFAFVAAEDRKAVERAWDDAVLHGSALDIRFSLESTAGTRDVRFFIAPVCGEGGLLSGFTGAATDVTEFVRLEAKLALSGAQYRAIAEAMPQLAWVAAPDGTIEYFNEPWLSYTGLGIDAVRKTGVKGVVHPDDVGRTWELWNTALATGSPYEIQYRLKSAADGTYRWFLGRATPMHSVSGEIEQWIGTATDIDAQVRSNANLRFVIEASAALANAYDVDGICRTLSALAVENICDWCFIVTIDDEGAFRTSSIAHRDPAMRDYVERFRDRYPVRSGGPMETAMRKNVPILVPSISAEDVRAAAQDEQHYEILQRLQMHSAMLVPLSTEKGLVYGGLALLSSESARTFSNDDLEVVQMVAQRAAAAIHTAHVFEDERRRSQRLHFTARASELVFESFDLQSTFDQLCEFIVSEMADLTYIMLIEDGSTLRTVSCAHRDPAKAAVAARLRGERTLRPEAEEMAIRMLSAHRPLVHPHVTVDQVLPNMWEYLAPDVRALNVRSAVTVPLYSRGETLGALVAYWCDTPRSYGEGDLPVFNDLGRRLSIAIEHVNALERERRIAEALQQALLPSTDMLPAVPGLTFSAEYRPSSREADVGGDWFDAVELEDGTIMVSVGDVTGRGLAAAGLMGKLRQAINMASMYRRDPARVLDDVDFQLRSRRSPAIVTAFLGFISPDRKTIRYANAGHPPPMLRTNGELTELRSDGLPLGIRDSATAESSREASLEGAELLALFTDGLIEGTRDLEFGERRLRQVLLSHAILYGRNPARLLCDACLPFEAQDDTAVLTVLFGERTHWSFDAENAQAAHDARSQFVAALKSRAAGDADVHAAELVFGELVGNVVRHAPGPIDVQLDWSGPRPVLHITDRGKGFVRDPALPSDPLSESGRGLYIIAQLTQELRIERIPGYGNHVAATLTL